MQRLSIFVQLLVLAFAVSSTSYAASFPSIVDARVQAISVEASVRPTINVADDDYVDLFEIDDIDNDGIRDFQFQVFTQSFYDQFSADELPEDMDCPSTYIAASSLVGSTLEVSDAIEIKGLERLYGNTDDAYSCFYSYSLGTYVVNDINNDQAPELLFSLEDSDDQIGSILAFGRLGKGAVIDVASILDGNARGAGFTISSSFKDVAAEIGDINGDGYNDLGLLDYAVDEDGYAGLSAFKVINSAALVEVSNLSPATLEDTPALLSIGLEYFQPELLAVGDYNGDSYSDFIMKLYSDHAGSGPFIIYGEADLAKDIQTNDIDSMLTKFSACSINCGVEAVGDVNADGFDDVALFWYGKEGTAENTHAILYGGEAGLPDAISSSNSTFIDFGDLAQEEYISVFGPDAFGAYGDINNDGASDFLLESANDLGIVLLGSKGPIPERINSGQLNGENGFLLVIPEFRYSPIMFEDANDDGIDDIVISGSGYSAPKEILVSGRKASVSPVGLTDISIATGFNDSFITWTVPEDATDQDQLFLYIDDVLVDAINAVTGFYRLTPSATPDITESSVLRLQYADSQNEKASSLEIRLKNEFKGLRQLSAVVTEANTVELAWNNEPSNYVVWRNGKVIARINGNSYTDTSVSEGTEYRYHVTQDINSRFMDLRPQGVPDSDDSSFANFHYDCLQQYDTDYRGNSYRKVFPASTDSLLVVVDDELKTFATPYLEFDPECIKNEEFRAYYSGYEVYSSSAVELFWERSVNINGVVGYEVSLFGETIATLEGTSFFYDQLGDEEFYTFEVTAIAGNGARSLPATYYVYKPNFYDEVPPPPSAPLMQSEVYSSTAIELFWEKDYDVSGAQFEYAVRKNGELQTINYAQSYYDDGLDPATSYNFTVTPIDSAGVEGQASSATLTTFSDSGAVADTTMPTGGRGKVYSNNALELFWDRSYEGNITQYVIYRNEQPIGETDGITFYDSGLSPDTEYDYSISARDVDGNEVGIAALLTLKTNSP